MTHSSLSRVRCFRAVDAGEVGRGQLFATPRSAAIIAYEYPRRLDQDVHGGRGHSRSARLYAMALNRRQRSGVALSLPLTAASATRVVDRRFRAAVPTEIGATSVTTHHVAAGIHAGRIISSRAWTGAIVLMLIADIM